jgi:bacteriocin-like protein
MTDLNDEVRELSIDELDKVSGGGKANPPVDLTANKAIAANKAAALADAYIRG